MTDTYCAFYFYLPNPIMKHILLFALLLFTCGFTLANELLDLDSPTYKISNRMCQYIKKDQTQRIWYVFILNDLIGDPSYTINHRIKLLRILDKVMKCYKVK